MKAKLQHIISKWPLFLLLLPVFYFLHGWVENYSPGIAGSVIKQAILYTMAGLLISFILFPFLKSFRKAALSALFLVAFNFFFGSLHDTARAILGRNSFLVKYVFIIGFTLALFSILLVWLRNTKREFLRLFLFLNGTLIVLILYELAVSLTGPLRRQPGHPADLTSAFIPCDTCSKPDVYLIIADEYAGAQTLRDIFGFDNTPFENELRKRGFHVVAGSTSNYNATVYSMASLFSMDYISLSDNKKVAQGDMLLCRRIINGNNTGNFFINRGYRLHNISFFDLQGEKKAVTNYYFHPVSRILNFSTFINRFQMEAGFNFFSQARKEAIEKNDLRNDERADSLLRELARKPSDKPRFVYTHFTRPHHPYFFDRDGKPFPVSDSLKGFDRIRFQYTGHLLYTNNRLLQLIDHIRTNAQQPPVILLASDHGFRQYMSATDKKYYFINFCAILLPDRKYQGFYPGMTTVNFFRAILNAQFGQHLPILKDSTTFLVEQPLQ